MFGRSVFICILVHLLKINNMCLYVGFLYLNSREKSIRIIYCVCFISCCASSRNVNYLSYYEFFCSWFRCWRRRSDIFLLILFSFSKYYYINVLEILLRSIMWISPTKFGMCGDVISVRQQEKEKLYRENWVTMNFVFSRLVVHFSYTNARIREKWIFITAWRRAADRHRSRTILQQVHTRSDSPFLRDAESRFPNRLVGTMVKRLSCIAARKPASRAVFDKPQWNWFDEWKTTVSPRRFDRP